VRGTEASKFTVQCGEPEPTNALSSFFTNKNASRKEITNERFIDKYFSAMN
jgi:hypothetical protein